MMTICVAMEAQNREPKYNVKSRFFRTANPPGEPMELKGRKVSRNSSPDHNRKSLNEA